MGAADQPSSRDYVSPESVPGAIIADKYRVDGVIGRGGVGVVVAATHLDIAQRVAIKMIRDDVPLQHELLDRFQREARAAAMIRSEHVTRVLDVGRLPNGRPYIVMEFLDGEDLERVISRGAMPCKNAVDLALQTCEALAAAHRSGIIHRDLKPANLFLTRRVDGAPLVKVLDFGISKIQPLTTVRVGRGVETTSIMGSPGYMAPEQMKSTRDVDARADIWSVGAVLYELVVGRPAFDGSSMIEILNAIATCKPIPPSARVPGVPPALDRVIARCLTASPDGRFATVAALAVALQPFASPGGAGVADRVIQISREPPPVLEDPPFLNLRPEADPSTVTVMASRRRPSRVPLVAAAA
jgi:serine/threonine-protein kinase